MAGHTVTRAQLTEAVYQEVGLSRNESAELVESVIAEISDALERGEMVKISSFGSFAMSVASRLEFFDSTSAGVCATHSDIRKVLSSENMP